MQVLSTVLCCECKQIFGVCTVIFQRKKKESFVELYNYRKYKLFKYGQSNIQAAVT